MAFRIDYGSLGTAHKTPQGGYAIPADLTRAGVFVYRNPDGSERREWRPLAEVQREDTIASLRGAPLTVRHPAPGRIDPQNHDRYSRGHVGDDVRMDGAKTAATIYAQGKEAIDAIGKGWRQVSCGYDARKMEHTPGIVPEGEPDAGQRYDAIQRDIFYNHVALVPKGRAGDEVRLRLDAAGDCLREDEDMTKIEIIGGTEYEVGTPAHAAARTRQDAADAASAAELVKLRNDAAETKGALAAATARLATLEAESKQRADEAERVGVLAKAQPIMGKEWKADGLDNGQIIAAVIAKVHPSIRLDAEPEASRPAFIKGLWASLPAATRTDAAPTGRKQPAPPVPFKPGQRQTFTERYRADAMDMGGVMCDRPMAISRRKPEPVLQSTMSENQR